MTKDYFSDLTPEEKHIIKNKGTEAPFTGEYNEHFEAGIFICRACENPLYESNTKFNSGCGWPSFDDEIEGAITRYEDLSGGRIRTEICCAKCDGHLGHVFEGEQITVKDTRHCVNSLSIRFKPYAQLQKATFGAGCFWSVEKLFKEIKGVYLASVGYMGGDTDKPTYKEVCSGTSNHAEVVDIYFNAEEVSYNTLLDLFWRNHNPTTLNRQGPDNGTQYRSVIFYHNEQQKMETEQSKKQQQQHFNNKIVTQIVPASTFYRAEEYHQNYLNKNNLGSCGI
ncbi:MAG: bifunctional methionine sulfoxide reductase B/A protein [Flavobacteriales bacterium]|jgi:peptide methionine sulfoxide reductase msrA/msrB|nr:bifunctional methionine sulfoxide reductase B/A protein [Flavobacteriales bacterium]